MEMITGPECTTRLRAKEPREFFRRDALHAVLAELVRARFLEPLAEPVRVLIGALRMERPALFEDLLLDEDLRLGAEGERDRVGRAAVDRQVAVLARQVDPGEE